MTTSITLKLLSLAFASLPLLAHAGNADVSHDGFQTVGDSLVYVGTTTTKNTPRAVVRAKPAAAQPLQVGADGFAQIGDSLVYVGVPTAGGSTRLAAQ